jgi:hypothetical protein
MDGEITGSIYNTIYLLLLWISEKYFDRKQVWTKNIDKCNKMLCLSSRNMIDKTMCEVLWRNISNYYVNLRVVVGKHPQVILAIYFYLGQE